jgi:hypothetical protein
MIGLRTFPRVVLCILFLLPFSLEAQSVSDLALRMDPANPAPGQTVHIRAESTLVPLSEATIAWYVNGERVTQAIGETERSIVAGQLGSETRVEVVAAYQGSGHTATLVIRPSEIDLLWEADSYTPPFFKGRAYPSAGATLRMEALPRLMRGKETIPASELTFTWKRNGSVLQNVSGRGKSQVTIPGPALFGTDVISVEVRSSIGALSTEASVRIPSKEPVIDFYEDRPLFGPSYHAALGASSFIYKNEASFIAAPFYAPVRRAEDPSLVYEWRVNGHAVVAEQTRPNALTINAEGSSGTALVELALSHATNFFLSANAVWRLTFVDDSAEFTSP